MRKVIASVFVSLDGVMQAPGGPTEDPTGNFKWGGWLPQFFDEAVRRRIDALFNQEFDLLLGRRTYDIFAAYWPFVQGEEKALGTKFDRAAKHVITSQAKPLSWANSHRLPSLDALADLKKTNGPHLIIQGSSTLYPQLIERRLLDQLTVMTFPIVLGSGKRLFGSHTSAQRMRMTDHEVTAAGNLIATYEPAGDMKLGSFAGDKPSKAELQRREEMAQGKW